MQKRGQFYIIAAVIIISVILGFATMRNYARQEKTQTKVYDLGKELEAETGSVYDYGMYNGNDTDWLIDNWTSTYYEYTKAQGSVEDWILLYGNQENLTALTFTTKDSGSIEIYSGASKIEIKNKKNIKGKEYIKGYPEGDVNITFENFTYNFKLKQGQNLYFVIKSKGYVGQG